MKTSSFVTLVCSLALNGFNTFNQPALAEQLPKSLYAVERSIVDPSPDATTTLIAIQVGEKFGCVDTKGRMAIAAHFDDVYEFFDGLAAVQIDDKWGYIDESGRIVVAMQFDDAVSFDSGLAAVQVDDKWGFINQRGVMVITPSFDEAETFSQGLAKVRVGESGYL